MRLELEAEWYVVMHHLGCRNKGLQRVRLELEAEWYVVMHHLEFRNEWLRNTSLELTIINSFNEVPSVTYTFFNSLSLFVYEDACLTVMCR